MPRQVRLLHPEIFDDFWWPYFSHRQAKAILKAAKNAQIDEGFQPNLAVMVRTKNDRVGLQKIINHIEEERKNYKGRIDLVVVDTQSTDGTAELAKAAGAKLVEIKQKDFNYPKSINIGLEAVKPDVEAAFITVGHAQPAISTALQNGGRHFKDRKVIAVYSDSVPSSNASNIEKGLFYLIPTIYRRLRKGPFQTRRMHGGLTQGTNTLVRMEVWRGHNFDESYGHGGEDLAWGRWALRAGHRLIYEPSVVVHHAHGLGVMNFLRQVRYWAYISIRKGEFRQKKLARYRPDLFPRDRL